MLPKPLLVHERTGETLGWLSMLMCGCLSQIRWSESENGKILDSLNLFRSIGPSLTGDPLLCLHTSFVPVILYTDSSFPTNSNKLRHKIYEIKDIAGNKKIPWKACAKSMSTSPSDNNVRQDDRGVPLCLCANNHKWMLILWHHWFLDW